MKKISLIAMLAFGSIAAKAQKVAFEEYKLPNGLHVVLSKDNSAPVVAVSVMYHVGSKDESPNRTGFAHFFEHLLFEGSENIKRGEFMKYVTKNGGSNNANTTQDRTYYFVTFPSNQLETGLWLESERMMHPVINEIGVSTQNEVVKEEKRMRMDNQPYGNLINSVFEKVFDKHPYHNSVIGSMADLDSAKLSEFKDFFKKFYAPNNAVLSIAGDIDIAKTKKLVEAYFGPIPTGEKIVRNHVEESPITTQRIDTVYDANIQIPAIVSAYRIPGIKDKDQPALSMLSSVLSDGASSRLYKKMVDEKKNALQVMAFNYSLEDYGMYLTFALPNQGASLNDLLKDIDEEVVKVQNTLITEAEFTKIRNKAENNYVSANSTAMGIAENLATGYTFYNNTNYINEELDNLRKVTREDIQRVARKYLNPNQRVLLYYLPAKQENKQ